MPTRRAGIFYLFIGRLLPRKLGDRLSELRVLYIVLVKLEYHEVGIILGAGSPLAAFGTVGVTVLAEVGPSGKHLL